MANTPTADTGETPKKGSHPSWHPRFLRALRDAPNVSAAAKLAGVSRATVYRHRKVDQEFSGDWDGALEESVDSLVESAFRRARDGVEKPVFHEGVQCGSVQVYSDTLAIFLLKAHRPRVYADPRESRKEQRHRSRGARQFQVTVMEDDE